MSTEQKDFWPEKDTHRGTKSFGIASVRTTKNFLPKNQTFAFRKTGSLLHWQSITHRLTSPEPKTTVSWSGPLQTLPQTDHVSSFHHPSILGQIQRKWILVGPCLMNRRIGGQDWLSLFFPIWLAMPVLCATFPPRAEVPAPVSTHTGKTVLQLYIFGCQQITRTLGTPRRSKVPSVAFR